MVSERISGTMAMALADITTALRHHFKRYFRSDRGNMTMIASIAAIPVIAAAGMAVDYARISRVKDKMQLIVDGAALAAVGAKNISGTSAQKSAKRVEIASRYLANGLSSLTDVDVVGAPTINMSGANISISATAKVKGSFMNVLNALNTSAEIGNGGAGSAAGSGGKSYGITVRAEASYKSGTSYLCMLVLNNSAAQSLEIQGTADLVAPGCVVWVNSSSTSGLYMNGNASLLAQQICVFGGYGGSSTNYNPYMPKTGTTDCPRYNDPLRTQFLTDYGTTYAAAKASGGTVNCTDGTTTFKCRYNGRSVGGSGRVSYSQLTYSGSASNVTLQPGIYDGGIQVKAGATVRLAAGTYFIQNGKFEIQNATVMNADTGGVTIVLTEPSAGTRVTNSTQTRLDVQAQATLQIKAPSSGPFAGIAVAQHPDSITSTSKTLANTVIGGGTKSITGIVYYPTNILYVTGGGSGTVANPEKIATSDPLFAIVADRVLIEGNGQIQLGGAADFESAGLPALPSAGTGTATVSLK